MNDFEELSAIFRNEAHERVNELIESLQTPGPELQGDSGLTRARKAAHNLKGAALTVGARPIAGLCEILENEVQGLIASAILPTSEQVATWLYMATEMQSIVDAPNLVHLQLGGVQGLASTAGVDLSTEIAGYGKAVNSDGNVNAPGTPIDRLAPQVHRVAELHARLIEQAQTLEALCAEGAVGSTAAELAAELRSRLAPLRRDIRELGVVVAGLVDSVDTRC